MTDRDRRPTPRAGISGATWAALTREDRSRIYSGEQAQQRIEALSRHPEIGPTLAHDLRAELRRWAEADYLAGGADCEGRSLDLETALATARSMIDRLREQVRELRAQ